MAENTGLIILGVAAVVVGAGAYVYVNTQNQAAASSAAALAAQQAAALAAQQSAQQASTANTVQSLQVALEGSIESMYNSESGSIDGNQEGILALLGLVSSGMLTTAQLQTIQDYITLEQYIQNYNASLAPGASGLQLSAAQQATQSAAQAIFNQYMPQITDVGTAISTAVTSANGSIVTPANNPVVATIGSTNTPTILQGTWQFNYNLPDGSQKGSQLIVVNGISYSQYDSNGNLLGTGTISDFIFSQNNNTNTGTVIFAKVGSDGTQYPTDNLVYNNYGGGGIVLSGTEGGYNVSYTYLDNSITGYNVPTATTVANTGTSTATSGSGVSSSTILTPAQQAAAVSISKVGVKTAIGESFIKSFKK